MTAYIALARKEPGTDYGVDFPDFPGCVTAANTLEHARRMAAEALGFHVHGMLEDGVELPEPSPLDRVMAFPDNRGAAAFLVDVPEDPSGSVSVSVALPEELATAIDRVSTDRSNFLIEAARAKLERA